ncbi:MAG: type II toxin-antitoxin system PemK/MazF family toxin [Roseitalea sp.]|jgi:mRNA interferase MazF|nr:type II toxin-antitoxin system PemK/MazF family toxin [Roseitalea sp.]MBO6721230.1 type II toxin-antitoxin system PemK/MazF family toxin [Roseitalea sp.]MBO6742286.1 type II toxin-antitoxin system PemK/MazF family toxin [Roseitalea sp.]
MTGERELRAGDVVLIDFNPVKGSEQAGIWPAVVVSINDINVRSRRLIVCPITGNMTPWITKLALPDGLKTTGMVLTDQVRAVDVAARVLRWVESTDPVFLAQVRGRVGRWIGLELPDR